MELLHINLSYPGGNFGGNQLLDSSISLSPLYAIFWNDLHVNTLSNFHLTFIRLHSNHAKFTIFRVPTDMFMLKHLKKKSVLADDAPTPRETPDLTTMPLRSLTCM